MSATLVIAEPAGFSVVALPENVREKLSASLSAKVREKLSARDRDELDLRRHRLGLSIGRLAAEAGINEKTYRRLISGEGGHRALPAVRAVLSRLERSAVAEGSRDAMIRATYRVLLAAFCRARGLDPAVAHAQDPRAGATASSTWVVHAHARQAAIYLANTVLDVPQRRLAEALTLTPAAVCLALKSVEDRREDPALDALLESLASDVTGAQP